MTGSYDDVECPICRSLMCVLRHSGRTVCVCRNGHRFVRGRRPGRRVRWPRPGPFLALAISALLIALFLAPRLPLAMVNLIHAG
jgi:hypothetical protein